VRDFAHDFIVDWGAIFVYIEKKVTRYSLSSLHDNIDGS
jgi:hypothetical protein